MVFVQERKLKGRIYLYLDKSIRIGKKVIKISKSLGEKGKVSKEMINKEIKKFALEVNEKAASALLANALRKYKKVAYPFSEEDIRKIEEMNLKYKQIRNALNKKDWTDIKKRFIANFVFESNALEGNSLTLKNFSEIVFENRITGSADLREAYDARNSYEVFSRLFTSKKAITEELILLLHRKIMKNIDDRINYKKIPNVIVGRNVELTEPKDVPQRMQELINWYKKNRNKIYPLELAFRFHHKFELIHPFADGNGRVGRMLLNYILIKEGYYPIIIRKSHRSKYINALGAADNRQYIPLMRFALEKAKETYRKFFEVYYKYI